MTARTTAAENANELQAALGSDAAFEAWYRRSLPRVFSYVLSRCGNDVTLAEELSQQTFVAAIGQRARFDGRSDATTWLCGIARHKLADHFRSLEREERRRIHLQVRQIGLSHGEIHGPGLDDRAAIADALRSLPAAQRAVLAFVVLDDLPVAEAARLMGKSTSATQSLLHRARESFRQAYRGGSGDD
jgi:RNA polymerase sigma-70 factor (ECF subfamily)